MKTTDPVGVTPPGRSPATTAVNVVDVPNTNGLDGAADIDVTELAFDTVNGLLSLFAEAPESPAKEAVTV